MEDACSSKATAMSEHFLDLASPQNWTNYVGHISWGGNHRRDTTKRQFEGVEDAAAKDDLAKADPETAMPLAG